MPTFGLADQELEGYSDRADQIHVVTLSDTIQFNDFHEVLGLSFNVEPLLIFYKDEEDDEVPINSPWELRAAKECARSTGPLHLRLHKGTHTGMSDDDVFVDVSFQFLSDALPSRHKPGTAQHRLSEAVNVQSVTSAEQMVSSVSQKASADPAQTVKLDPSYSEVQEGAVGGELPSTGAQTTDSRIDTREKKRSWSRRVEDMLHKLVHDVHKIRPKRKTEPSVQPPAWFSEAMVKYMEKLKKDTAKECAKRTMKQLYKNRVIVDRTPSHLTENHDHNYSLVVENPMATDELIHQLDAHFLTDLSYPDWSLVKPSQFIAKHWTVVNNGQVPWPDNTKLVYLDGDLRVQDTEISIGGLLPGKVKHVLACVYAPSVPCRSIATWALMTNQQKFGDRLWCKVFVSDETYSIEQGTQTCAEDLHGDRYEEEEAPWNQYMHSEPQPDLSSSSTLEPAANEPRAHLVENVINEQQAELLDTPAEANGLVNESARGNLDFSQTADEGEHLTSQERSRASTVSGSSSDSDFVVIPVPHALNLRALDSDTDDEQTTAVITERLEALDLKSTVDEKDDDASSDFVAIDSEDDGRASELANAEDLVNREHACQSELSAEHLDQTERDASQSELIAEHFDQTERDASQANEMRLMESTYHSAPGTPTSPYRSVSSSPVEALAPPVSPRPEANERPCSGEVSPFLALSLSRCSSLRSVGSLDSLQSFEDITRHAVPEDTEASEPLLRRTVSSESIDFTQCDPVQLFHVSSLYDRDFLPFVRAAPTELQFPSPWQEFGGESDRPDEDRAPSPCYTEPPTEIPENNDEQVEASTEPECAPSSSAAFQFSKSVNEVNDGVVTIRESYTMKVYEKSSASQDVEEPNRADDEGQGDSELTKEEVPHCEREQDLEPAVDWDGTSVEKSLDESAAGETRQVEDTDNEDEGLSELGSEDLLRHLSQLHDQVYETIRENDQKLTQHPAGDTEVTAAMQALKHAQLRAEAVFTALKLRQQHPERRTPPADEESPEDEGDVAEEVEVKPENSGDQSSTAPTWAKSQGWQPPQQQWVPTTNPWVPKPSNWQPSAQLQQSTPSWRPMQSTWKPPAQWTPSPQVLQAMIPPPTAVDHQTSKQETGKEPERPTNQASAATSQPSVYPRQTQWQSPLVTHKVTSPWTPSNVFLQAMQPPRPAVQQPNSDEGQKTPNTNPLPGARAQPTQTPTVLAQAPQLDTTFWPRQQPQYAYPQGYQIQRPFAPYHPYPPQVQPSAYPNFQHYSQQTRALSQREQNLQTLKEMGFYDECRNNSVLDRSNDHLQKALLMLTDH